MEEACGYDEELLEDNQPIFSLDNSPVHETAEQVVDVPSRAPLPPYSPDMHKVIEHTFNWLNHSLKNVIPYIDPKQHSIHFWGNLVQDMYCSLPVESVRKDVESLRRTYQWIIENLGKRATRGYN